MPCRPAYGTAGSEVTLWTNHFELIPSPKLVLYRYDVKIEPPKGQENAPTGKKLAQIFKLLLEDHRYREFQRDIVTDFRSTLLSRCELNPDAAPLEIQYRVEGENAPRVNAPIYRLSVTSQTALTVSDLTNYLASTNMDAAFDKQPLLQALNIFLHHYSKSRPAVATVGRSKSFPLAQKSPEDDRDLGAGLIALQGFFSSVRAATNRILVNVNVSHGAFYKAIVLDKVMQKYGTTDEVKLQRFLKRVRVKMMHLKPTDKVGNPVSRVKTIWGLANINDGRGLDHPPRVPRFGAGPEKVEFFLNDAPEAPASSSTGQAARTPASKNKGKNQEGGRYISVYDFFQESNCSITSSALLNSNQMSSLQLEG